MRLEEKHIKYIQSQFQSIEKMEDLLHIINYAKSILYPNVKNPKPIKLKSLWYYSNPKWSKNSYKQFNIKKKSGSKRTITAPVAGLKLIQRCLNLILNVVFIPHSSAKGFVQGSSVVDNASEHVGKNYVYNIDIKDFFPSINFHRIKKVLQLSPFYLKEDIAFRIANLCCHNGILPQGAPTSPTLTNIVCQKLDRRLFGAAKRFGATYTRYADDITFSSPHNIYQDGSPFINEMKRIIHNQKFELNEKKTRLQKRGYRQEVTGLTVNKKTNLKKRYIREVRAMLNNWEKQGLAIATQKFRKAYIADKGHVKNHDNEFINVLHGKLEYMKMVRGSGDQIYIKYKRQFDRLIEKGTNVSSMNLELDTILEIWKNKGINEAMRLYSQKI